MRHERLGIFGASGMAKEVSDIGALLGFEPFFIVPDQHMETAENQAGPRRRVVPESGVFSVDCGHFVIGIGDSELRSNLFKKLGHRLPFTSLIHPAATCEISSAQIREASTSVIVGASAVITSAVSVGVGCIFNIGSSVSHDCNIGDFVTVSPKASILGNVNVGDGCLIGANAVILQGSKYQPRFICPGAVIGAGAVVTKDVVSPGTYVGMPARKI